MKCLHTISCFILSDMMQA